MNTDKKIHHTTKEFIYTLRFPKEEVIKDEKSRRVRSFQLMRALRLGNLLKNKVDIYFKDSNERLIRICTTIWGVTSAKVILKKGVTIPIHRITTIE